MALALSPKKSSLQEAFRKYQEEKVRQRQIKRKAPVDPRSMDALRRKFVDRCLFYKGTLYSKKWLDESDPRRENALFLDCCGLVRKAVRDLQDEFGFWLGGGNQAYQYDTLGPDIAFEDMKRGDLIFYEATYHSKKAKKQKHNIVHIEVYLGEGERSVGARYRRGAVQEFESFRFKSTLYHSIKFHFKSIDPWLRGECQSHCKEHPWVQPDKRVNKYSVFYVSDQESAFDEDLEEEEEEISSYLFSSPQWLPALFRLPAGLLLFFFRLLLLLFLLLHRAWRALLP